MRGLRRFGLGLRIGDLDRIGDPRAVLLGEAERREVPLVRTPGLGTSAETARRFFAYSKEVVAQKKRAAGAMPMEADGAKAAAKTPYPQRVYADEVVARFDAARAPLGGFGERLAQFWSNHFCVSGIKGRFVLALAGPFEREVIRPHVFGRFEDMLVAVETHPAMLYYLDNQRSVGPNSPGGKRRGRGLNENLAREILELHTLGADGGYGQADVTAFAAVLTGWAFSRSERVDDEAGTFAFNRNLHEPGPKSLLGRTYPDDGVEQGRRVLHDLARHPSTAVHVARKLAHWFVADAPPDDLVAHLAQVFRRTDGDLGAVSAALISSDAAWTAPATKMRTPQEFVTAATRAIGRPFTFGQIGVALRAMGQPLWQPRGPNGHPADVAALTPPNLLQARLDVAAQWARLATPVDDPRDWSERVLGPVISEETRRAVAQAESQQQAIALALMSPEFQRR